VTPAPQPGVYVPVGRPVVGRPALFLDRDGVVNVNHGYVHTAERTQWLPGIFDLCAVARDAGYVLVIVTNQAGIARGYYSEAQFLEYTRWVHEAFAARGVPLHATIYCPHHPLAGVGDLCVECGCRKPAPGMFETAARLFGLALDRSVMVGDKETDLVAASRAGVHKGFLVEEGSIDPFDQAAAWLRRNSSAS
jgi:D-glycero-D-manno-heptose 1,7-bisphosphate phosphatase